MALKEVELYTDGACSGNPGPGGYGAILVYKGVEKEFSEGFPETTNNKMELLAVIVGLRELKEKCKVHVTTDSKYVSDAINQGWVISWQAKDFRRGKRDEVKNIELWEELIDLLNKHEVTFTWVKGHAGHPYNERCDKLAVKAYQKFI